MKSISVIIIDDHWVVREGIKATLQTDETFQVVGEASSGEDGLTLLQEKRPDVALVDIRLPDISGTEICQKAYEEGWQTAIVVITALLDWRLVKTCLHWGVRGYLLKGAGELNLKNNLLAVMRGETVLDPKVVNMLTAYVKKQAPKESGEVLTPREMEILRLISQGLSNREIGEKIYLSQGRVKDHVHSILQKLNTKNRVEAILIAAKSGLL
ncbi:MAG: response regulator transcription factor [Chloroflexi bacterium]|nr:response regulator transcription factor [Chloroflexota bacterium]